MSESNPLWKTAKECDALYICPKDANGKRKGPLVAYAGKDDKGRNLVGDLYFNFRKIEPHILGRTDFAQGVEMRLRHYDLIHRFDTICGIPEGGRTLAQEVCGINRKRFIYPTKVPKPTEPGKKQEYSLSLAQFDIRPGERLLVMEDVFNNFQNTDAILSEIGTTGAEVVLLGGALNRSPIHRSAYIPKSGVFQGKILQIIAAISEPFPEWTPDDPEVQADVVAGNVEFQVKDNWSKLMAIMDANR